MCPPQRRRSCYSPPSEHLTGRSHLWSLSRCGEEREGERDEEREGAGEEKKKRKREKERGKERKRERGM